VRLPNRDLGGFAGEVISRCTASQTKRLMRGAMYRNLFLTGDPQGVPQTYNKTGLLIEKLASWLYSPIDMRYGMVSDGPTSPSEKAMGTIALGQLHRRFRAGDVDRRAGEAVKWSLIKGKAFISLRWTGAGFEADLVQPEVMGVEREDLSTLDQQQAFVHSTWYTIDSFVNLVWNNPDKDALLRKASALAKSAGERGNSTLKNVMVGGGWNGVYQAAGSGNPNQGRGSVPDWMGAPSPHLAPELASRMLQVDTLWVRDDDRDGDWTTIQMLADAGDDAIIYGKYQHRNAFADAYNPGDKSKTGVTDPENPLKGMTPYIEFCPNDLDGYFWGRSELDNCALLQRSINRRIDGINLILRQQEEPPRAFLGMAGATQNTIARLNKPGGWYADPSPAGKIQNMLPEMPPNLFQSFHELSGMLDDAVGVTPTLGGQGDAGVRSQNHAETLLRGSTPHIKDRAIDAERSVSELGNLGLTILKVMIPDQLTAWVRGKEAGIESAAAKSDNVDEPPVKDLVPLKFSLHQLPDHMKVVIDGHSSSPAFMHEHEQKMFQLAMRGAISPQMLVRSIHPPHEEEIIDDMERKAVDQAEMIAAHPEILTKGKKPKM